MLSNSDGGSDHYVTVREFATQFRVSKMTVYRMIRDGRLRAIQVGRQFRIPASQDFPAALHPERKDAPT